MLTKKSITIIRGFPAGGFLEVLAGRKPKAVFVLEGRPELEGTKAFCQALLKKKITPTLISDNMAGFLFYKNLVKEVWVTYQGLNHKHAYADVGGLILSVLGKKHGVPVYLFPAGKKIKAMGRGEDILNFNGKRVAAQGIKGYVPLIERLPKKYITKVYA